MKSLNKLTEVFPVMTQINILTRLNSQHFLAEKVQSTRICIATIQRGCFVKIANFRKIPSQLAFSINVETIPYHKNQVGGGSMILTYFLYYIALVRALKGMRRLISQKKHVVVRLVTLTHNWGDSTKSLSQMPIHLKLQQL